MMREKGCMVESSVREKERENPAKIRFFNLLVFAPNFSFCLFCFLVFWVFFFIGTVMLTGAIICGNP